jgi:hypothetical protein
MYYETFARRDQIVLLIFHHRREADMRHGTRVSVARQGDNFGEVLDCQLEHI